MCQGAPRGFKTPVPMRLFLRARLAGTPGRRALPIANGFHHASRQRKLGETRQPSQEKARSPRIERSSIDSQRGRPRSHNRNANRDRHRRPVCAALWHLSFPSRREPGRSTREAIEHFQDLGGVTFRRRRFPDVPDAPLRPDQYRRADDAQRRLAHEAFEPARAVRFDGVEFGIAQKREIQRVFRAEPGEQLGLVAAAPGNRRLALIELRFRVPELGRFLGSARGHGLGEKEEREPAAPEIGQRDFTPIVRLEPEIRRGISRLQLRRHRS